MSGPSTIGALRVVLGLDSANFTDGLTAAQAHLKKVGRQFEQLGAQMSSLGQSLTLGITAPVLAMGAAALKASSDFETAMIKVKISTKATTAELAELESQARAIGKSTIFSAGEAADAMDMLAKTGLSVAEILGGAAKATVDLAAATGSELEPAAAAVSDSMKQFKIDASALPAVVNQITGAVNESKLDFKDFQLAMGQAGGVAAGLGVSFEDFNAVLAATSSNFASGSDAGTSFKTFLTRMVPSSKQAAEAMAQYGISFFDAQGGMKSMSDIAEMLKQRLGGLNDEAKTDVLTKIFGTDAMRTGMGLMEQGAAGIDRVREALLATDAAAQSAERMKGFAGQLEELKGSLEELGIAIGKSGLLEFATQLVTGLAGLVDRLSSVSPELLQFGTIAAAVAAAIGPLVMAAGAAVSAIGVVMGVLAAPVAVPIIATVAAVAAAFAIFGDTLVPALRDFGAEVADVLGPKIAPMFEALMGLVDALADVFAGFFGADTQIGQDLRAFGQLMGRVWGAQIDIITAAVNVISNLLRALGALLTGDFSGAWKYAQTAMWAALEGLGNAFATLFPELVSWAKKAYEGIRQWLGTMLPKIFETVKAKIREVGDVFFELYDRVVGHSYVPDMVEGVAAWMAKLDAGMVQPAKDATKKTAEAFKDLRDDVASILEGMLTDSERKLRDYKANVLKIREGIAAGIVTDATLNDFADRTNSGARPTKVRPPGSGDDIRDVAQEHNKAWTASLVEREAAWDDSLKRMGASFKGAFQEWVATGKVNWKRLLLDMADNFDGVLAALKKAGGGLGSIFGGGSSGGGVLGQIASSVGGGLGGIFKTVGGSIGSALGGVGKVLTSMGGPLGAAASSIGSAIGGISGALGGVASTLGAALGPILGVLGPIGIIAGIGSMLLKSKPSNNAALATFDAGGGYSIGGNKRTDETTSAATAAANAVRDGQAALAAFGISLGTTVRQIDIGTRDLTHIFLTNGQELRSAVGDPAAAAEAALKAVLQGATFASDAQKALVESMLAAGKGFDEVTAALNAFGAAQNLPQQIADAIQQLRDPEGYDVAQLKREQEARRKSVQAQVDAGYLTAEQLASLGEQLTILEGLELDKAFGRLAGTLDAVAAGRDGVRTAYEREKSELDEVIARLKNVGASLRAFGQSLVSGPLAMLSPKARYEAAKAEMERVRGLAMSGDADAQSQWNEVARAFLEASLDYNASTPAYFEDLAGVRASTQAMASLTDGLLTEAEAQLDALNKQVAGQIELNKSVLSVRDEITKLHAALAAYASVKGQNLGANPSVNAALVSATGYAGDFGSGGWQAWITQQSEQIKAAARQVLEAFGQPERIVGFANGGSFRVGGSGGIDSQLVKFRASPNERVTITKPGQMIGAANDDALLRKLDQRLASVEGLLGAQIAQQAAIANRAHAQGEKQISQLGASTRAQRAAAAK